MGVVIGETAIIEDDVVLFHGVTLGGTGKEKETPPDHKKGHSFQLMHKFLALSQ